MNRRDIFKYVAAVPAVALTASIVAEKATKPKTYDEVYNRIKKEADGTYTFTRRRYLPEHHPKDEMHL